jgi:hypothetical protein
VIRPGPLLLACPLSESSQSPELGLTTAAGRHGDYVEQPYKCLGRYKPDKGCLQTWLQQQRRCGSHKLIRTTAEQVRHHLMAAGAATSVVRLLLQLL